MKSNRTADHLRC